MNGKINVCDEAILSFLRNNTPRTGSYESCDTFWDTWVSLAILDGIFQQHNPGFYKPIISLTPKGIERAEELAIIYKL